MFKHISYWELGTSKLSLSINDRIIILCSPVYVTIWRKEMYADVTIDKVSGGIYYL